MNYKIVDMDTYPRKEHFNYYTTKIPCGYSVTVQLDVTNLYNFHKQNNISFYAYMIYVVSKTVNEYDNMKMMMDADGNLGIWDIVHPSFTIFHEDDETFSDVWMEYNEDLDLFLKEYENVIKTYGNVHGIKARNNQPPNFYCISCAPWLDFSGYSSNSSNGYAFFPIITYGRYNKENERMFVPFAITINHAVSDGYHTSKFLQKLQENINKIRE